jgi:hypothetical protein
MLRRTKMARGREPPGTKKPPPRNSRRWVETATAPSYSREMFPRSPTSLTSSREQNTIGRSGLRPTVSAPREGTALRPLRSGISQTFL